MKVKELGKVITGKTPSTAEKTNYGFDYRFVTPPDLLNGYKIDKTERYISNKGLQSIKNNSLSGTSVLVGCIGSDMGNVGIIEGYCASNQQINAITLFKSSYNPFYIYYWLRMKKEYLRQIAGVTNKPILPKNVFEQIDIEIPSKNIQDKIASVLVTIDDKIKLNNKVIADLEAMAITIYDYWFVQFEFPNNDGKPYKSSGGKMAWNERLKREIPGGWDVHALIKCCDVIDCLHSKKPNYVFEDEQYYLLQLENLVNMGLIDLSNKYYVTKDIYKLWTSRIEVKWGDLVITNAGRVGSIGRIPHNINAGIGRNMTAIRPIKKIPPVFLYYFFNSPDMKGQIKVNKDLGSFFSSLNVKGIKKLLLTIPDDEENSILFKFEEIVSPIRERIELNAQENFELQKLRDWLLPMLMNGQITIRSS